jgi:hypothetical protein
MILWKNLPGFCFFHSGSRADFVSVYYDLPAGREFMQSFFLSYPAAAHGVT